MPTLQQPSYCLFWAHQWWPFGDPWWLCMDMTSWAAWAQAFGSIMAIIASAGIGWWLHKMQVRAERLRGVQAHLKDVQQTRDLLRLAEYTVRVLLDHMDSMEGLLVYLDMVEPDQRIPQMSRAIGNLSEKDAPTASLLLLLLYAQKSFELVVDAHERRSLRQLPESELVKVRETIRDAAEEIGFAAKSFDKYITEQCMRLGA